MTETYNKDEVIIKCPTFDDVLLELLLMSGQTDEKTLDKIERLRKGESLWLTLF